MYESGQPEIDAVSQVIRTGQLFRYRGGEGGQCDQFEAALKKKVGVEYALMVNSGTSALICALVSQGLGPGDEVLVPAYTFMATALAVLAVGAVPILVEVDQTLLIDVQDMERKITPRTKAFIPVHMLGRICDMDPILALAKKHNIVVVEDAAQAMGGTYKGRFVGTMGQAGAYSYNHFKIIGCGEGGAFVTHDMTAYDRGLIFHDGGAVFRAYADKVKTPFFAGYNFRTSEMQGAFMRVQLERLDGILSRLRERRRAIIETINDAGSAAGFRVSPVKDDAGDCGTTVPVIFDQESDALGFVAAQKHSAFKPGRPFDTGRHVYCNWSPVLEQHGSHHPMLSAFRWAKEKIEYHRDMCPATLDILKRTVVLATPYSLSVPEVREQAKAAANWATALILK